MYNVYDNDFFKEYGVIDWIPSCKLDEKGNLNFTISNQGNNNINFFDPGVQGEHKIRRGFQPHLSSSFHYFLRDDLDKAISDFCLKESKGILQYKKSCEEYTPIKNEYRIKS